METCEVLPEASPFLSGGNLTGLNGDFFTNKGF
jgi:hypothetical protein